MSRILLAKTAHEAEGVKSQVLPCDTAVPGLFHCQDLWQTLLIAAILRNRVVL